MSWFASFGIAFLTAIAGGFVSGFVANLYVNWYHVSGREGASGYLVVAMFLMGAVAGGVLGVVVSRVVAAGAHPGALRALGLSMAVILGVGAVTLGVVRALADVPPTIEGEELMLVVEVRWPEGHTASPATDPEAGSIALGSVPRFSHTQRASVKGVLWKSDARLEDGRWIVPGAVQVFTGRGRRTLLVSPDDTATATIEGFLVPLPGRPGKKDLEWSDWLPRQRAGGAPATRKLTYRYRVQRVSQPIRTEKIGPFDVLSSYYGFYNDGFNGNRLAASAQYTINYQGTPYVFERNGNRFEHADAVAALAGEVPALLVHVPEESTSGVIWLLAAVGDSLRAEFVSAGIEPIQSQELTSDSARFVEAGKRTTMRGWIDRTSFDHPGVYLVGQSVVDTRRYTARPVELSSDSITWVPSAPPLGLSPDERSFIRYGYAQHSDDYPVLVVIDAVAGTSVALPIDPARMHYANFGALDPAWVLHHFAWTRGSDGVDHLAERKNFVPIPWRGILATDSDGPYYRLEPGKEPLRDAVLEFLVAELHAEPIPGDSGSYQQSVRINGQQVNVSYFDTANYLTVSMARGSTDSSIIPTFARRFDAALATGKYDALFTR